ncbi:MAG TPA: RNA polymerase sigma factor [Candidatus Mediterraneibacter stercoripullorum]|nr:RNA polymerase sigma factor [Candidatus Mediterraneibacter stercoripullorum]
MTNLELEQFITEYGREIYSFCVSLCGSRQEADDLYQDTFLTALEKIDRIDIAGNIRSYLLSVAVRLWKNRRRKRAWRRRIAQEQELNEQTADRITAEEMQDVSVLPEERILEEERLTAVRRAVSRLPDRLRVPVLLYYMEERQIMEISEILRLPEGTVKSRLHQARKRLERELESVLND